MGVEVECPNCNGIDAEKAKVIVPMPDGNIRIVAEGIWCNSCGYFTPEYL